jgi:uncharacterized protein (TIGR02466 family)
MAEAWPGVAASSTFPTLGPANVKGAAALGAGASRSSGAEQDDPSVVKSNQGGWQSPTDFLAGDGSAVATLRQFAMRAVEIATARLGVASKVALEFQLSSWAAVNRYGHYNTPHMHPMATWSGVYYVDPGDETPDAPPAALEFAHPIAASVMTFFPSMLPTARLVRPEAGVIILFPGYLQHSVRMYHGDRPRVCVPFNAHLRIVSADSGHSHPPD